MNYPNLLSSSRPRSAYSKISFILELREPLLIRSTRRVRCLLDVGGCLLLWGSEWTILRSSFYSVARLTFEWEVGDFASLGSNSFLLHKSDECFWTNPHTVRVSSPNSPWAFFYWSHPWSSLSDSIWHPFLRGSSPLEVSYRLCPGGFCRCGRCAFLTSWGGRWILLFGLIFRGWC
jgi:hypothetical protein